MGNQQSKLEHRPLKPIKKKINIYKQIETKIKEIKKFENEYKKKEIKFDEDEEFIEFLKINDFNVFKNK